MRSQLAWALIAMLVLALSAQAQTKTNAKEPPVKTVHVNGVDIAYIEAGTGEPIILVHGFLHDYRVWLKQVEGLSKQYRVIAYSKRYRYPNAPAPENADITLKADIDDLVAFIHALKIDRVHLAGHSGGAAMIALLARDHPELVRSLILGEGFAPLSSSDEEAPEARLARQPFVMEARKAYDRGDIEEAIRIFARAVRGNELTTTRPLVSDIPRANAWELRRLGVPDTSVRQLTCDEARRSSVPILFMRGEKSPTPFQASAAAWKHCQPQIEEAVLPGASHGLQLHNPAGYNQIVLRFLSQQKRELSK
jgi:pimeloyl-ACP methyl ester carboxylesterase